MLSDGESAIHAILQNGFYDPMQYTSEMHNHPTGEFYVPISPNVVIWINESVVTLHRGEVCYIAPQVYHRVETLPETGGVVRFNVDFSGIAPEGKEPFWLLYQQLDMIAEYLVINFPLAPQIIELCLEAARAERVELMIVGCMTAFFGGLAAVAAYVQEDAERGEDPKPDSDIKTKISWFFDYNYTAKTSVEDLAQQVGYSVRQLERVVRAIYGKTFSQVLTESRIRKTLQYLRDNTLSLAKIAALAGYRSYKGYCCAFRKQLGLTPSKYRKHILKEAR